MQLSKVLFGGFPDWASCARQVLSIPPVLGYFVSSVLGFVVLDIEAERVPYLFHGYALKGSRLTEKPIRFRTAQL
jgi:hypothetical protein